MQKTLNKRQGWDYLLELARKEDRALRQSSLIRAYSWVEHALSACSIADKKLSTANKILFAKTKGILHRSILDDSIQFAIQTRHLTAHKDQVANANDCYRTVRILRDVWNSLKQSFVTRNTAALVAKEIQFKKGIKSVHIYGSLARSGVGANDIDILVFDDGRYSDEISDKAEIGYFDAKNRTLTSLAELKLTGFPYAEIVNCRWIDIFVINESLFGNDYNYTKAISGKQHDPFFFLNISKDILMYDPRENHFGHTSNQTFIALKQLIKDYKKMGF